MMDLAEELQGDGPASSKNEPAVVKVGRKRPKVSKEMDTMEVDVKEGDRDLLIRLVPSSTTSIETEVKVNSTHLQKHCDYFDAFLSERWRTSDSPPLKEISLYMVPGAQASHYADCFSRMHNPLHLQNFENVQSSLDLLHVASHIRYHKLVRAICKYLPTVRWSWSDEDEQRILRYSSCKTFPRPHEKALAARLQRDCVITALRCRKGPIEGCTHTNFPGARLRLEKSFWRFNVSPGFLKIFTEEARSMISDFHDECEYYDREIKDVYEVPRFVEKLEAVRWLLQVLVKFKLADPVVEFFLQLPLLSKFFAAAIDPENPKSATYSSLMEFARVIFRIHREVASGEVVVGESSRVALLENWALMELCQKSDVRLMLPAWGYVQAVEGVFSTLPLQQQMELVLKHRFGYLDLRSSSSHLANLVKMMSR